MFGSMRADFGYPLGVIRPHRLAPRPLSGLAELLGVGRTTEDIQNGFGILSGVTLDSRAVRPGDLYAALPGARTHGAAYSDQAVAAGAVAILTDPDGRGRAARTGVPVFVVSNPRERLGDVACWVYGDPSHRMTMIGVTGTSGKTTTSYLCEAGLRAAGHKTGLVGGVEIKIGQELVKASLTTPEAPDLQALLAVMAERGVTAAAMEVSSHSLALGRVAGTRYAVAVFTNLSQDHLDFHSGFEDYFRAKAKLFTPAYSAVGVVNVADRYGRRLVAEATVPVTTFCADAASGAYPQAEWRAADVRCGADGSTFRVIGPGGVEADASVTLPGPFNVANALGAIVALVEAGVDLADAVDGVAACPGVPGRLQRVPAPPGQPDAFVDYSHKPGAVEAVLTALRPVTSGELIVVLGCGGDRDRGKRPLMGAAAARLADVAIFTSDNPRTEDPLGILDEMLHGVLGVPHGERARLIIEPDRAAAIDLAVAMSGKGDVVLVAGKGHETGQYVGGDRAAVRRRRGDRRRPGPSRRPWRRYRVIPLTLAEVAAATSGDLSGDFSPNAAVTGPVVIDSRQVVPGALFAALPGEHVDGHDYAAAAARQGAAAILAARPLPAAGAPVIVVSDVTLALGMLARAVLDRLPDATVVGITGSSGKTSTKDLTAQVVERIGPTIAPEGSLNNEIGLPLTVLRADETTRYLVLEMSARGIGHIAYLTGIAPPRIGAVLNVGRAHAGEFGSIDAVAKAKGELVEALPAGSAGGVAVLNADDPNVAAMAARTRARVVTTSVARDGQEPQRERPTCGRPG